MLLALTNNHLLAGGMYLGAMLMLKKFRMYILAFIVVDVISMIYTLVMKRLGLAETPSILDGGGRSALPPPTSRNSNVIGERDGDGDSDRDSSEITSQTSNTVSDEATLEQSNSEKTESVSYQSSTQSEIDSSITESGFELHESQ